LFSRHARLELGQKRLAPGNFPDKRIGVRVAKSAGQLELLLANKNHPYKKFAWRGHS
jgi:hypothetical protein